MRNGKAIVKGRGVKKKGGVKGLLRTRRLSRGSLDAKPPIANPSTHNALPWQELALNRDNSCKILIIPGKRLRHECRLQTESQKRLISFFAVVKRLVCNQEVAGSIPVVSIRFPLLSAVVTPPLPLSALPFRATPVTCVATPSPIIS